MNGNTLQKMCSAFSQSREMRYRKWQSRGPMRHNRDKIGENVYILSPKNVI